MLPALPCPRLWYNRCKVRPALQAVRFRYTRYVKPPIPMSKMFIHETFMTARRHQQTMNKKFREVLSSHCANSYWERFSLDSVHETALKQESTNRCSQSISENLWREHEDENSILSSCLFLWHQPSSHFIGWGNFCASHQKSSLSNHNLYR